MIKSLFEFFWDRSTLIFLIIGGVNSIITMVGSTLLQTKAKWSLFTASALMFAVTSVPSFILNRKFSFESTAPLGQSIIRFALIIVVCFLLSYFLSNLVVPWAKKKFFPNIKNLWYTLIRVVGLQVIFTVLNYTAQRLWAFAE